MTHTLILFLLTQIPQLDKPASEEKNNLDLDLDASSLIITSFVPIRPTKPLPKHANKRPEIIVLDETKHRGVVTVTIPW